MRSDYFGNLVCQSIHDWAEIPNKVCDILGILVARDLNRFQAKPSEAHRGKSSGKTSGKASGEMSGQMSGKMSGMSFGKSAGLGDGLGDRLGENAKGVLKRIGPAKGGHRQINSDKP